MNITSLKLNSRIRKCKVCSSANVYIGQPAKKATTMGLSVSTWDTKESSFCQQLLPRFIFITFIESLEFALLWSFVGLLSMSILTNHKTNCQCSSNKKITVFCTSAFCTSAVPLVLYLVSYNMELPILLLVRSVNCCERTGPHIPVLFLFSVIYYFPVLISFLGTWLLQVSHVVWPHAYDSILTLFVFHLHFTHIHKHFSKGGRSFYVDPPNLNMHWWFQANVQEYYYIIS